MLNMENKYDIFISYRRDGGFETAKVLHVGHTQSQTHLPCCPFLCCRPAALDRKLGQIKMGIKRDRCSN